MAAVIVNFRQVSPVNSFLGLVDKFDHPTGRTTAQGLDFDDSLSTKIDRMKRENLSTAITH